MKEERRVDKERCMVKTLERTMVIPDIECINKVETCVHEVCFKEHNCAMVAVVKYEIKICYQNCDDKECHAKLDGVVDFAQLPCFVNAENSKVVLQNPPKVKLCGDKLFFKFEAKLKF